jgi:hypothetical protein
VRNFSLLNRVVLRTIALSLERNDHLHVALGAESARLEQRNLVLDATLVHIATSCHIVQSIGDRSQSSEESIAENFAG